MESQKLEVESRIALFSFFFRPLSSNLRLPKMKTLKFTTNIHCESCEAKVRSVLDEIKGIRNLMFDMNNSDKMLSIECEDFINSEDIVQYVKSAGYSAKPAGKFLGIF